MGSAHALTAWCTATGGRQPDSPQPQPPTMTNIGCDHRELPVCNPGQCWYLALDVISPNRRLRRILPGGSVRSCMLQYRERQWSTMIDSSKQTQRSSKPAFQEPGKRCGHHLEVAEG